MAETETKTPVEFVATNLPTYDNRENILRTIIKAEKNRQTGSAMGYTEKKATRAMAQILADIMAGRAYRWGQFIRPRNDRRAEDGDREQKLQRLIRRHFPSVRDSVRQAACGYVEAKCWPVGELVWATGDDAVEAYAAFADSHLTRACMTGSGNRELVELYRENEETVTAAHYKLGDQIVARRLVWRTNCNRYALDRQYPNGDTTGTRQLENAIVNRLGRENCLFRSNHSQGDAEWQDADGQLVRDIKITVRAPDNERMPYLDSFKYADDTPRDVGTLTLTNQYYGGAVVFTCTGGGWTDNRAYCVDCDERHGEDGDRCAYCQELEDERQEEEDRQREEARQRLDDHPTPATITRRNAGGLFWHVARSGRSGFAIVTTRQGSDYIMMDGDAHRIRPVGPQAPGNWRRLPAQWQQLAARYDARYLPPSWIRINTDNGWQYYRNCHGRGGSPCGWYYSQDNSIGEVGFHNLPLGEIEHLPIPNDPQHYEEQREEA